MITAGAGGMYCGSCLQDNALAAALTRQSVDIQLLPTYTPIRTDESNQSGDEVFFGGINVYLQQTLPILSRLPRFLFRWLDRPQVLRWATRRGMQTNAQMLGDLTVSMLQGHRGNQAIEVERLLDWLERHGRPEIVHFSNMLISGCAESIKQRLGIPVFVTLQGDDLFLGGLTPKHHERALCELQRIDESVDAYIVHSKFYADHMSKYLGVNPSKFKQIPLAISPHDLLDKQLKSRSDRPPTVGYMARIAPEKGLHTLVDAFCQLRNRSEFLNARLIIAGWLGADHREYADESFHKLDSECGRESYEYRGMITREEKRQFFADVDVVSVPTSYQEPKGLYVLESLAAAIPVAQPAHGIFPELIESAGGGRLYAPADVDGLTEVLGELLSNHDQRHELGKAGRAGMLKRHSTDVAAATLRRIYEAHV